jgi:xanthine dehydrogenase accessory factor
MAKLERIEVVEAQGSTPRDKTASMVVSAEGQWGTIGGGRLEYDAIDHARARLNDPDLPQTRMFLLGPQIGQCCGGQVTLRFEPTTDQTADTHPRPKILIFGGGHVGRALAQSFAPLPVSVDLIETRPAYLKDLPSAVTANLIAAPEAAVHAAPPKAAYIVTTHDHALDFLIVEEAVGRGDAAYVGMIGSKPKRGVLTSRLRQAGLEADTLTCPIGAAGLGDKRPEIIAAYTVTEVLSRLRET